MSSAAVLAEEGIERIFTPPASTQSSAVTVLSLVGPADQVISIAAGLQELREIVGAVSNHSPLELSPAVEIMIERAVHAHGRPTDVEAWARRLADDVRNLAD